MSGLIDLPSSWESPTLWQSAIPADHRDFSRPRQPFQMNAIPKDLNSLDDIGDENIKAVQQFLSQAPLGIVPYNGPIDGKFSNLMLGVLANLQIKASISFPEEKWNLFSSTGPSFSGIQKLMKKMVEKPKENNSNVKDFQMLFSLSPTGIVDSTLISKIKEAESNIAAQIGDDSVHGMIWNDATNSFNTTPQDVAQALKLLKNKNNF